MATRHWTSCTFRALTVGRLRMHSTDWLAECCDQRSNGTAFDKLMSVFRNRTRWIPQRNAPAATRSFWTNRCLVRKQSLPGIFLQSSKPTLSGRLNMRATASETLSSYESASDGKHANSVTTSYEDKRFADGVERFLLPRAALLQNKSNNSRKDSRV